MNKLITLITMLCFTLTSCNTVKGQRDQAILISSNPEGAQIDVDGYYCGTTPNKVLLNPKYQHTISLEKDGYYPETYVLQSKVSGKKLANNMVFPVAGLAVGAIGASVAFAGCASTGGICLALVGICGAIGLAAGTATGALGAGVDACSGKAKSFSEQVVHLNLHPSP